MSRDENAGGAPLQHTRQVTIDALCEHFANDVMSVEEFESRVDRAHAADSADDLKALLQDLPGAGNLPVPIGSSVPAETQDFTVAASPDVQERGFVVAVMGGTGRKGRWQPARKNFAVAICGGAEIDFREAVMPPGVTELQVYTMWGGVEVVVPPGMNVESHGIALMGGFEHVADSHQTPDPNAPTLRITGVALMAGVDVQVRHAGESARDARRRRKFERREQKKRLRGG